MKAIVQYSALPAGPPNSLVDYVLADPTPGPTDLLIEIEAVSIDPADARIRLRKADDGLAAILGYDAAGRVGATRAARQLVESGKTIGKISIRAPFTHQEPPK